MSMQFVQRTLHSLLGVAQIVCSYAVPSHSDIAGGIQHTEVEARHSSIVSHAKKVSSPRFFKRNFLYSNLYHV